jgi:hypothetical protein
MKGPASKTTQKCLRILRDQAFDQFPAETDLAV